MCRVLSPQQCWAMVVSRLTCFGDDAYPHTLPAFSSPPGHFWDLPSVVLLSRTQDRLGDTRGPLSQYLSPTEPRADAREEEKRPGKHTSYSPLINPILPQSAAQGLPGHHSCVVSNPLWTSFPSQLPLNRWGFLIYPCCLHTLHFPFTS